MESNRQVGNVGFMHRHGTFDDEEGEMEKRVMTEGAPGVLCRHAADGFVTEGHGTFSTSLTPAHTRECCASLVFVDGEEAEIVRRSGLRVRIFSVVSRRM
jgi:hypothetical protein